jgi:hypothetical protein
LFNGLRIFGHGLLLSARARRPSDASNFSPQNGGRRESRVRDAPAASRVVKKHAS